MKLHFIIPIRHPAGVRNPDQQRTEHAQTFASIAAQEDGDWQAILVVNKGQFLPPLSSRFIVEEVDFEPNTAADGAEDLQEFYRAFRADKGRRVAAAMRHVDPDDLVMVVDDDDLVSRHLAGFVLGAGGRNGWYIENGYAWRSGTGHMQRLSGFHHVCGTSLIVPARYYEWFKDGDRSEYFTIAELGSHKVVFDKCSGDPSAFRPVPFYGAIYRTAHANSSRQDVGRLRAKTPRGLAMEVARAIKWRGKDLLARVRLNEARQAEFFGLAAEAVG